MKLQLKILFLLVTLNTAAFSQILVGPIAGGNYSFASFSNQDLKSIYKVGGVFGYHVGGHLAFKVRKRFFLHSSFIYSTKGRTISSETDQTFKFKTQYNFIELPVSYTIDFKARLGQSKEFKYLFGIGPNISYWLGGKGTAMNADLAENNITDLKYEIRFKPQDGQQADNEMGVQQPNRVQFGLNFVAGLVLEPADRQRIMITARYELGHTYLAKSNGVFNNTYFQDPLQSRNQGLRVSVAYMYDLKTENRNKGKSTIDRRNPKSKG